MLAPSRVLASSRVRARAATWIVATGRDSRGRGFALARRGQRPSKGKGREEIAHALGLSRQAVHQAEARALARLRTAALRRWLPDDPAS